MVTWHDPVPEHAPPHPANTEPGLAIAVNWTTVPLAKLKLQACPQLMPAGLLETVPVPVPEGVTVSAKPLLVLKVAVTDFAALTVTWQAPVPEQAPLHPAKVEFPIGVAAN